MSDEAANNHQTNDAAPVIGAGEEGSDALRRDATFLEQINRASSEEQARLLKQMHAFGEIGSVPEDALGVMVTDLLLSSTAKVAEAAGPLAGESAKFAIDRVDQSLERYQDLLERNKGQ
ncbi:hypothetical protein [Chromobacterium aquaticum]|uniref:Uncharacterized protein n=1 Tax=Chromobacterium aquaticum TaxID=467180 RepID=A0ABV8ZX40_9NEIS|nr:hypothetical protein [Chromobacterium aquaticum]MCD5361111.1 hypothetical protein [Chromobacterium aquaticum]